MATTTPNSVYHSIADDPVIRWTWVIMIAAVGVLVIAGRTFGQ